MNLASPRSLRAASPWHAALVCVLLGACRPSAPAGPPEPVDAARLYQRQCAVCHGATGQGDGPSAGINRPSNLTQIEPTTLDEEIATVIREGRGLMPPWGHLRDDEIDALVRYVRRLADEGSGQAAD